MSGKEAWNLVAPMITPLMAVPNSNKEMVYDLYLTVFHALKEYDKGRRVSDEQT